MAEPIMNARSQLVGAVDIGGTKIAVGVVSETGWLLAQSTVPTQAERGPEDALARIGTMLREAARQAGGELKGIGIGSTGPVDPFSGKVGQIEFLPGWEGFNLVGGLAQLFHVPVALENDADAAALGEVRWGAGRGAQRFIYCTISTGIGVGLVFDGRLYRGVDGAHPEIGHHVIDPSGPACSCGAHGCWESLASGPAMARWLVDPALPTAQGICEAALQGHPGALRAVERTAYYLSVGVANLVTLYTPDIIALGGGLMNSRALFWEAMQNRIEKTCGYVPREKTSLVPAGLGIKVGLLGAACTWLHRFESEEE